MAETIKVLGQLNPSASTLTALYTVPASTSTTVSTIVVCNRNSTGDIRFRISVAVAGATDDPKQYLFYDVRLDDRESFTATIGITLAATDVVRVYADDANVAFNLFGAELT